MQGPALPETYDEQTLRRPAAQRDIRRPLMRPRNLEFQAYPAHLRYKKYSGATEAAGALPSSLDWRSHANLTAVQNQGTCGSCWAMAATQMLADRLRIAGQKDTPLLSTELVKDCAPLALASAYEQYTDGGREKIGACSVGGMLSMACEFLTVWGTTAAQDVPYSQTTFSGHDVGSCPRAPNGAKLYTAASGSATVVTEGVNGTKPATAAEQRAGGLSSGVIATNCTNMQHDIMQHGPLAVTMTCYHDLVSSDFDDSSYPAGVYVPDPSTGVDGGHSVTIVGWGVATEEKSGASVPYWIVRNSWGVTWNGDGYFKIVRGQNACAIESAAVSVEAAEPPSSAPKGHDVDGSEPLGDIAALNKNRSSRGKVGSGGSPASWRSRHPTAFAMLVVGGVAAAALLLGLLVFLIERRYMASKRA